VIFSPDGSAKPTAETTIFLGLKKRPTEALFKLRKMEFLART